MSTRHERKKPLGVEVKYGILFVKTLERLDGSLPLTQDRMPVLKMCVFRNLKILQKFSREFHDLWACLYILTSSI